jgi:aspartyl-tRNA(Asn)/glutamyl-tRNA(Gln) amidotransferase subunit C
MSVTRQEVERIAQLAELGVDDATLPTLVDQMSRILDYVAQIAAVGAAETAAPFVPGPVTARFRRDEVIPAPRAFGPDRFAPAFRDGFFLVPRLGAFEAGDADGAEDEA